MIWVYNYDVENLMKDSKKTEKESNQMEKEFEIFTNRHRLAILSLLKMKGGRSVGQISDHLEISFNTTSRHLLYLAKKGILKRRYDGSFVIYEISNNLSKLSKLIISYLP